MAKGSDKIIQNNRALLLKRVKAIRKRFKILDDMDRILDMRQFKINRILARYRKALKKAYRDFYEGPALNKTIREAEARFNEQTQRLIDRKLPLDRRLRRVVKQRFVSQASSIVDEIVGRQRDKIMRFKLIAEQASTKIEKKRLWQIAQKRSGRFDTVQFRNGAKFPLQQYTAMKTTTSANETHRLTTTLEANRNDLYTGKVSSHGASDSCKFHENEIVFFSQAAKNAYLQKFPKDSRARKFKTVQELEADRTHIFKPNCKHIVTIWPIQFFDDSERTREVQKAPLKKIPKKIDERKISAA